MRASGVSHTYSRYCACYSMGRPAQINLVYNTTVLQVQKKAFFWLVDQKWYARRLSNFVNVWIWCSGTLQYFLYVCKGNERHVTAGKVRGTPVCICTVEVC